MTKKVVAWVLRTAASFHLFSLSSSFLFAEFSNDFACWMPASLHLFGLSSKSFSDHVRVFSVFMTKKVVAWVNRTAASFHLFSLSSSFLFAEFANDSTNDISKDFACWMPASLHLFGLSSKSFSDHVRVPM